MGAGTGVFEILLFLNFTCRFTLADSMSLLYRQSNRIKS